jgi:hypothetical protein
MAEEAVVLVEPEVAVAVAEQLHLIIKAKILYNEI